MLIEHLEKRSVIDASAYIAPNATVCNRFEPNRSCIQPNIS